MKFGKSASAAGKPPHPESVRIVRAESLDRSGNPFEPAVYEFWVVTTGLLPTTLSVHATYAGAARWVAEQELDFLP